ncbi:unnamed protein product [Albugo candida]|uniref:TRP C-terminal domain-containing protein n=1 Tax=Albugo candida TaxID=65357 RepID=A0A024GH22_9STRA|nr:unnamed protein product [Albugo candida]|eukprot:CCI45975.1 unnamed protein product [Albugo candida]
MPLSKWKLIACVYVITLRFVKSDVTAEDTESSELGSKTYTNKGRTSEKRIENRNADPPMCTFAYSSEPIAEAITDAALPTIEGKGEKSNVKVEASRTNSNPLPKGAVQDVRNVSTESRVRFLEKNEKLSGSLLPSALNASVSNVKGHKFPKVEPDTLQNEKEDGYQEFESLKKEIIDIKKIDTSNGTRDTDGSNAKEEEDEGTEYVPSEHVTIGKFACNETFYKAWNLMRLRCGGDDLNVIKAVQNTQCAVYSGKQINLQKPGALGSKICLSTCKIPACIRNRWDYTVSNGLESPVYQNVNYLELLRLAKISVTSTQRQENVSLQTSYRPQWTIIENLNISSVTTCNYNITKQCACNLKNSSDDKESESLQEKLLEPPEDKGFENWNHWSDGLEKTTMDKAGIASAKVGQTAAAVSVALSGAMTVVTGMLGTTSTTLATTVTAGAGVGLTVAAMDLCQFSVMINQLNLQARPRFLEKMGEKMSFSTFTFLPFGEVKRSSNDGHGRRLSESDRLLLGSESDTGVVGAMKGMERYARVIGIQVDMLFYVTLGGIAVICCVPWAVYLILVLLVSPCVRNPSEFRSQWLDKTIGIFILIIMLTQYVIGATATFQICLCIQRSHMNDPRFAVALITLLVCSLGTLAFGYHVLTAHQDELKDVGTQEHLSKSVYVRYGPLYEEYRFESRYFFAPKLLLALLSGMTTGTIFIHGWVQLVILIALHGLFFILLEWKHPYPSHLIQKTTSFVIFIKMSVLGLSFFLLSTTFESMKLPFDLRQSIALTILGLQVLVLCSLLFRQMFVFYRTWRIRRDGPKSKRQTSAYSTQQEERELEYAYDPYTLREIEMGREKWMDRPVDHRINTLTPSVQVPRMREQPKVRAEPIKEWRRT